MYVEIGALNEQGRAVLEGMGFNVEGAGAETRLLFTMPEPGSRQIMIAPKLAEVPLPKPEELIIRIQMLTEEVNRLRSNRFLSGAASPEEITQGTATAIIGQTQQAAIPYSASVKKQSMFWKRLLLSMRNCILLWDKNVTEKAQKQYFILTSGEEPMQRGKAEAGSVVYVDAVKMGRKFETFVFIRNVTEAEQAQRDARAVAKFDRGLLDPEQLLDEMGFDDPVKQKRLLNKERERRAYAARFSQLRAMSMDTLFSALTGMNLALLAQPQPVAAQGQPTEGESLNPGQRMQPPPVGGPVANSSPMAGQMV